MGFSLEQLWHWFILSWPLRCWSYFQFYGMADCFVAAGMCPQNPSTTNSSGYSITSFRTLLQIVPSAEIQQLKFSVRPQRSRSSLALALLLWIPPFIITVILSLFISASLVPFPEIHFHFHSSEMGTAPSAWPSGAAGNQKWMNPPRSQSQRGQRGALSHTHRFKSHLRELLDTDFTSLSASLLAIFF